MEDASSTLLTDDFVILGVYDGHGGSTCSDFLKEKLLARVSSNLQKGDAPKRALENAFESIDDDYCDFALKMDIDDGSTATVLLLKDKEYYLAAAGDSRAVLVMEDGTVEALSHDHKPDRRDERLRVTEAGGQVEYDHDNGTYRVFSEEVGGLAVTRALGDAHFKPYVTGTPEITSGRISSKASYVVMASDGLWDDVTNAEAGEVICEMRDRDMDREEPGRHLQEAVKELVYIAYSRGSEDNITVLATDLQRYLQVQQEQQASKAEALRAARAAQAEPDAEEEPEKPKRHHYKRTIPGLDEYGNLSELLLWKNPLRTFLWFSVGCLTFFLTHGANYSLLTLGSYLLMMQIVITTFVVKATPGLKKLRLVGENFDATIFVLQGSLLSDEIVRRAAEFTLRTTTSIFSKWNTVVQVGSAKRILLSLRFISYLFSPLPLDVALFVLFVAMFSLPATYFYNQPFMDRQYNSMLASYHRSTRSVSKLFGWSSSSADATSSKRSSRSSRASRSRRSELADDEEDTL
ncbi:Protein phosphatase 1L [Hondaea fermentalgiana]|uniref:Protein phosphatase 1L n=1 Tax=Hondaea fermentalgiana TaxID=2315210 RepID=A0A2R5GTD0_9STRA|nr:Protein phosphatase 1L [Hondaea fermentalgiana]|eukprot:GBG34127.1 Protein phosphatase 1L [Hondaea fermentalgiana]